MSTKWTRRDFLMLAAAGVAGCSITQPEIGPSAPRIRVVNVGPVSDYAVDGVYAGYRASGFFIVRRGNQLFAMSSICTHRRCRLDAEPDHSFFCPCHGSMFDPAGHVTKGPAKRDLPTLETTINEQGELLIKVPAI